MLDEGRGAIVEAREDRRGVRRFEATCPIEPGPREVAAAWTCKDLEHGVLVVEKTEAPASTLDAVLDGADRPGQKVRTRLRPCGRLAEGDEYTAPFLDIRADSLSRTAIDLGIVEEDGLGTVQVDRSDGRGTPASYAEAAVFRDLERAPEVETHVAVGAWALADEDAQRAYYRDVQARVQALPGVATAELVNLLPMVDANLGLAYLAEGHAPGGPGDFTYASYRAVSTDWFPALGIPLVTGRGFEPGDRVGGREVGILNRTMAEHLWPGEDPIGKEIRWDAENPWFTVVGVVEDIRQTGFESAPWSPIRTWRRAASSTRRPSRSWR